MAHQIVGAVLVGLVYLCFIIVIFGPTIYTTWLYIHGRKAKGKARGLLKLAYLTFAINLAVSYFLVKLAFECYLPSKVSEWQDLTRATIRSAVASEKRFFASHGRYYAVGPVRGPFRDSHGLSVEKDVILEVVPLWDHVLKRDTFRVYAVHVLAKSLVQSDQEGELALPPADSGESKQIKSKLFNSVK